MVTRSRIGNLKSKQFSDHKLYSTKFSLQTFHTTLVEVEPSCYNKAPSDSQ